MVFAAAVTPYLLQSENNPQGPLTLQKAAEKKTALRENREEYFQRFAKLFYTVGDEVVVSDAELTNALEMCRKSDQAAALGCMNAFSTTDFRDDLLSISVPTLVIHGDSDAVVPFEGSGKRTHQIVKHSDLLVVTGAPHGLNVSHAQEFNRALIDFAKQT